MSREMSPREMVCRAQFEGQKPLVELVVDFLFKLPDATLEKIYEQPEFHRRGARPKVFVLFL